MIIPARTDDSAAILSSIENTCALSYPFQSKPSIVSSLKNHSTVSLTIPLGDKLFSAVLISSNAINRVPDANENKDDGHFEVERRISIRGSTYCLCQLETDRFIYYYANSFILTRINLRQATQFVVGLDIFYLHRSNI